MILEGHDRDFAARAALALLVAIGTLAGCQEATDVDPDAEVMIDATGGDPDAAPDAAPDATPDAAADATPPDAAPDAAVDATPPDAAPPPDMMVGPPPCIPALSAAADPRAARPYDLVTVRAAGGTGAYRYLFDDNPSGALLNEFTGAYLAGAVIGAVDRVRVVDDGCVGEATVDIEVVPPMQVQPQGVQIQIEQGFTFAVEGGSGAFAFAMVADFSGGEVTPDGAYTAGPLAGQDIVRVTDLGTEETVDVIVIVVEDEVTLVPRPARLYLPVGARMPLRVDGGSGAFDVLIAGDAVSHADGIIEGIAPGRSTLSITDRFLGLETSMRVDAVESLSADMPPFNVTDANERLYSPGDLDGDGVADLVVANAQANDLGGRAGAVHVFHSSAGEAFGAPVQVLGTGTRTDFFGHDVTSADLDGDGFTDLIVGARLLDVGVTDNGAVLVYRGLPDGTFDEAPAHVLAAPRGSDQLGYAVGVCDFNGDGLLDIAGAATQFEDREVDDVANTQGGVLVWLGYPDGYLDNADSIVVGQRLEDDGRWLYDAGQQLGWSIGTGDVDGDGLCDLVVGSQIYRDRNGGRNRPNAGAVFVFRGAAPDALGPGGLEPRPAMALVDDSDSNQPRFGRKLSVADVDGDGRADILVGAYLHDPRTINAGDNNGGAAFLFRGRDLPRGGAVAITGLAEADWTVYANSGGDQLGFSTAIGDVTGDGLPDVLVGAWTEDYPGRGDAGAIFVYAGQPDGLPTPEPVIALAGPEGNALYGQEIAVVGDLDGDGIRDIAGHAERSDTVNVDVGDVFLHRGGPAELVEPPEGGEPALEPFRDPLGRVDVPTPIGNAWFGYGAALVGDVDDDGLGDAVVGAPFGMAAGNGVRSGAAWLYRGDGDGIDPTPASEIGSWTGHTLFDFGFTNVGPAGDVDGDGIADWWAMLRDDERFNPADASLWVPDECKDGNNNRYRYRGADDGPLNSFNASGGLWVFRGAADGIAATPSYVYWPTVAGNQPEAAAGGFDIDGDGFDDFVVGGFRADAPDPSGGNFSDAGLIEVIYGRPPADDGRVRVLCDRALKVFGDSVSEQLGRAVVGVPDLDGDGCDEVGYGAINFDEAAANQGAAWIVGGFGPGCATAEPRILKLTAGLANEQTGWSMAAGDLDGDGLAEVAVGAPNHRADNQTVGGAWVLRGSWLGSQLAAAAPVPAPSDGADPPTYEHYRTPQGTARPLNPDGADWLVQGQVIGERFGTSVAIADGKLAVGGPLGAEAGVPQVGVVRIYRANANANRLIQNPWGVFVGETWRPEGRTGETLHGGRAGDRPAVIIGGYQGQGTGLDNGSAYVIPLD